MRSTLASGVARVDQLRLGRVKRNKACRLAGLRQRDPAAHSKAATWRVQQTSTGSTGTVRASRSGGLGIRGLWASLDWAFFWAEMAGPFGLK